MNKRLLGAIVTGMVAVTLVSAQSNIYVNAAIPDTEKVKSEQINYYQEYYEMLDKQTVGYDELVQKCKIDEMILKKMSNEELWELVLTYPLQSVFYVQDSVKRGFEELYNNCDALKELLNREDWKDTVCKEFFHMEIPRTTQLDYEELIDDNNYVATITELVVNDNNLSSIKEDSKIIFEFELGEYLLTALIEDGNSLLYNPAEVLCDKYIELEESEYSTQIIGSEDETLMLLSVISEKEIKTPGGNTLYLQKVGSRTLSDAEVSAIMVDYKYELNHGYMEVVSNGTTAYNCHAYAWLSELSGYQQYAYMYSINDVTPLIEDKKCSVSRTAKANWIGNTAQHSVLVKSASYSWRTENNRVITEPYVESKWGNGGPLVKHPLQRCPYSMNGIKYYRFK